MRKGSIALLMLLAGADVAHAAGDVALGQHLSSECVTCHRTSGPPVGGIPAIRGWPVDQFVAVMLAYKNKQRENNVMQSIAGRLAREDIEALAAYFGSLK
jgi:cytochrome c553